MDINKVWLDGTKGRTTIYFGGGVEVVKEQGTVLDCSEDFVIRPMRKQCRKDRNVVQTAPCKFSPFHKIYKAIAKRVLYNKHDKVARTFKQRGCLVPSWFH